MLLQASSQVVRLAYVDDPIPMVEPIDPARPRDPTIVPLRSAFCVSHAFRKPFRPLSYLPENPTAPLDPTGQRRTLSDTGPPRTRGRIGTSISPSRTSCHALPLNRSYSRFRHISLANTDMANFRPSLFARDEERPILRPDRSAPPRAFKRAWIAGGP